MIGKKFLNGYPSFELFSNNNLIEKNQADFFKENNNENLVLKDLQIELEANVSKGAEKNYLGQDVGNGEGGFWPEGKIYYIIKDLCHDKLLYQTLQEALKDWME